MDAAMIMISILRDGMGCMSNVCEVCVEYVSLCSIGLRFCGKMGEKTTSTNIERISSFPELSEGTDRPV